MSQRMGRSNRSAFTLIELLLVLVIIGVLAAVVVPRLVGRAEDAKVKATHASVAALSNILSTFEVDNGRFPTSDEGLSALIQQPGNASDWHGPYLDSDKLKDAWGNPFHYQFPGSHNTKGFDLWSAGPDGQDGTADDITNWDTGK